MEIRYFQIIIPIIALYLGYIQYRDYKKRILGIYETLLIIVFWIGVAGLALFPDFFSKTIASVFGIKSNINAIIFLALGLLFYFQLQMYKTIKQQDEMITKLTRKIALKEYEKE